MKTANQILAAEPSEKELSRIIDKRMDAIANALDALYRDADETAVLIQMAGFNTWEIRNNLLPLLRKAEAEAKRL